MRIRISEGGPERNACQANNRGVPIQISVSAPAANSLGFDGPKLLIGLWQQRHSQLEGINLMSVKRDTMLAYLRQELAPKKGVPSLPKLDDADIEQIYKKLKYWGWEERRQ
jgi:hypothetical protein